MRILLLPCEIQIFMVYVNRYLLQNVFSDRRIVNNYHCAINILILTRDARVSLLIDESRAFTSPMCERFAEYAIANRLAYMLSHRMRVQRHEPSRSCICPCESSAEFPCGHRNFRTAVRTNAPDRSGTCACIAFN